MCSSAKRCFSTHLTSLSARDLQHERALDPGHATTRELLRSQRAAFDQEQVAHGAADHVVVTVAHETFRDPGVAPFGARKHVLEAAQVLDPGQ